MIRLELRNLFLSFGNKEIIKNLNLCVNDGELVALLGPSGVGKSTILRAIAGLLSPESGKILLNRQQVNHLPPEKRDIVLMFQKSLLFPFLNVFENVAFGLKMAKMPKKEIYHRVEEMLALVEMEKQSDSRIHQLSGGQQQRVALARALVLQPSLLLLDEPFSSLDKTLRDQMRQLLLDIQQQTKTTMLFVTHDQAEALSLSNRIALLLGDNIRQFDEPKSLFHRPKDEDVALFFGNNNVITISMYSDLFPDKKHPSGEKVAADRNTVIAVIRPENIQIAKEPCANSLEGEIISSQFEGVFNRLSLKTRHGTFTVLCVDTNFKITQKVWAVFPLEKLYFF